MEAAEVEIEIMISNDKYQESAITRAKEFPAVADEIIARLGSDLSQLQERLTQAVALAVPGHPSHKVQAVVSIQIQAAFDDIGKQLTQSLRAFAADQTQKEIAALGLASGAAFHMVDETAIKELLIVGGRLDEWLKRIADELNFRILQLLRTFAGHSTVIEKIQGTKAKGFRDSEINRTLRALDGLVRTALDRIGNEARLRLAPLLKVDYQWQQLSVLDNRTSEICRDYANRIWDKDFKPIGHNLPFAGGCPRHWNCRSLIVICF